MPTDFVLLSGKGKWVKLARPNQYGKWSLDLYMDDTSIEKFKAMKVKNHLKKDEDGYYATFSRPVERQIRGKAVAMAPPIILDKNNVPLPPTNIGNGSDLVVKLEHYSYKSPLTKTMETACRLYAVRVENLVPFDEVSYDKQTEDVIDLMKAPHTF